MYPAPMAIVRGRAWPTLQLKVSQGLEARCALQARWAGELGSWEVSLGREAEGHSKVYIAGALRARLLAPQGNK